MNKSGELTDMLIFVITIFIFAVGLLIFMFIVPNISAGLRTAGLNSTSEGAAAINTMDSTFTGMMNNGFMMLFVGLSLSILITSFLVRTHPIFLFLYILFLGITILLTFYLGNTYETIIANPTLAPAVANATFLNLIMSHIAEITVAVGALSMIIIFSKFSTFGGTQQY